MNTQKIVNTSILALATVSLAALMSYEAEHPLVQEFNERGGVKEPTNCQAIYDAPVSGRFIDEPNGENHLIEICDGDVIQYNERDRIHSLHVVDLENMTTIGDISEYYNRFVVDNDDWDGFVQNGVKGLANDENFHWNFSMHGPTRVAMQAACLFGDTVNKNTAQKACDTLNMAQQTWPDHNIDVKFKPQ